MKSCKKINEQTQTDNFITIIKIEHLKGSFLKILKATLMHLMDLSQTLKKETFKLLFFFKKLSRHGLRSTSTWKYNCLKFLFLSKTWHKKNKCSFTTNVRYSFKRAIQNVSFFWNNQNVDRNRRSQKPDCRCVFETILWR